MRKVVYALFVVLAFASMIGMPFMANYQATKALQDAGYTVISTKLDFIQATCTRDKHRLKVDFKAKEGNGYICITIPYDLLGSEIHVN